MRLQYYFMEDKLRRLIQSRKVKVELKGELYSATDNYDNIQWRLKYRLVPKT